MGESKLAAELAIRSLVARYCDGVARRDSDLWGATWAADGEWSLLGSRARGRAEVVALFRKLLEQLPSVIQFPGAGTVEVGDGAATGRHYVSELGKTSGGGALFTLGVYDDEYTRASGEWLFARRSFTRIYMGPPDLSAPFSPVAGGGGGKDS